MGRGDKKTRRGKIVNGSYGRLRPRKKPSAVVVAAPKAKKTTKAAPKKAAPKKAAPKKTAAKKTTAKKTAAKK